MGHSIAAFTAPPDAHVRMIFVICSGSATTIDNIEAMRIKAVPYACADMFACILACSCVSALAGVSQPLSLSQERLWRHPSDRERNLFPYICSLYSKKHHRGRRYTCVYSYLASIIGTGTDTVFVLTSTVRVRNLTSRVLVLGVSIWVEVSAYDASTSTLYKTQSYKYRYLYWRIHICMNIKVG